MTLRNYRPFVNSFINTSAPIYRHVLTPLTATHDRIEFYTNTNANDMQGVLEELAETITYFNKTADNEDIYQAHFDPSQYDFPDEEWIQLGNGDAIANCLLNVETYRAWPEDVINAAYESEYMQPYILEGVFYEYVDAIDGMEHWTQDRSIARSECAPELIDCIEEHKGFMAYLSAPGYMDMSEPEFFETYNEAAQYLLDER